MKTTLRTFICFLLFALFVNVSAQDGTFEYVLTGKNEPIGFKQLDDNSSVAVSNRTNSSPNEISVLKVSNQAQLLWSKNIKLSSNFNSIAYDFIVDRDKNIIIVGSIQTSSSFILKLNGNDGSVIFSKIIVNNNNFVSNRYYRIIQMNSGFSDDYVLTGSLNQPSTHSVSRIDKNGNTIWAKEYDVSGGNELTYAVVQAFDGDIILGCNMSNGSHFDQGVIKLNPANGNVKMLHKINFSYGSAFNGGFDAGVAIEGTKLIAFTLHLNGNSNPTREGVVLYNTETQSVVNAQLYNIGFQARSFSICYDNLNSKIIIGGGYLETNNNNLFFHSIDINNLKQVKTYKLKSIDYNSFQTGFAYLSINNLDKILFAGYISGKTPPITSSKIVLVTHTPSRNECTEELITSLIDVNIPNPSTSTISLIKNYTHSNNTPIITDQTFPINKLCQEGCIPSAKLFNLSMVKPKDTICQNYPNYSPKIQIAHFGNDTLVSVAAYRKVGSQFVLHSTLKDTHQVQFNFTALGNTESFMFVGRRSCSFNDTIYLDLYKHQLSGDKFLHDSVLCVGERVTMRSNFVPNNFLSAEFRWFDFATNLTLGTSDTLVFVASQSQQIGLQITDYCSNPILLKSTMHVAPTVLDSFILLKKSGCVPLHTELIYPTTQSNLNTQINFKWYWLINDVKIDSSSTSDGQVINPLPYVFNVAGVSKIKTQLVLKNNKVCAQFLDSVVAEPTIQRFRLAIQKPIDTFCQNLKSFNAQIDILNNMDDSLIKIVAFKKTGTAYVAFDSLWHNQQVNVGINNLANLDSFMFVGKRNCSFNDTVFLSLYMHKLIAENILYDSLYCMGEMVKMRNDLTPSAYRPIYYRWFDQLTNTTFSIADTLEFPSHTSMEIGLHINDNCSDIIRLNAKIYVSPMVLDSNILFRKSACEPLQTEFIYPKTQRHFDTRLPFYWLWSLDGVLIDSTLSEDGRTHDNRAYTFDSSGNYVVNVKMKLGNGKYCHSFTDTAYVFKRAKAEFSFFPTISDLSDTAVQFVNQSAFANSYQWQVSDGGVYSTKSPFHRFKDVGNYSIQLIAKTNEMCNDTLTKNFTIFDAYKIFTPSGFTPNGNGLNEVWGPQITSAKSIDLKIYNRWGELLLHKTELPCTWDGSYKNEPCQEGIYVYLLTIKSNKGRWYYYKGTLELLR